jgi:hypothetical protein
LFIFGDAVDALVDKSEFDISDKISLSRLCISCIVRPINSSAKRFSVKKKEESLVYV